jgi:flavodoxin
MPKKRKSLILYQTMSGNTEKVAFRFKKVFEKKGWKCDIFKVDKNMDADNLPFDFQDYDFLCVG